MEMFSKKILVDNTGADIRRFYPVLIEAVKNGGKLPEDLADTFVIKLYQAEDGIRGLVYFA